MPSFALLKRVLIECRNIRTKVIAKTNQRKRKYYIEPMKIQSEEDGSRFVDQSNGEVKQIQNQVCLCAFTLSFNWFLVICTFALNAADRQSKCNGFSLKTQLSNLGNIMRTLNLSHHLAFIPWKVLKPQPLRANLAPFIVSNDEHWYYLLWVSCHYRSLSRSSDHWPQCSI